MSGSLIILGALGVLGLLVVINGFKIVRQSEVMVVERLGKYNRTLTSGVNIIVPFFDKARRVRLANSFSSSIDLRESVYDFPKQSVITKDNVNVEINALLYLQVIDPVKAAYEISDLPIAVEKLTQTTLRNVVGELELDQTLSSRDTINAKLREILDDATDKWGVKVNRVELEEINPPRDIKEAMEKQMRAERDRRARVLEAEGIKESQILRAEGQKQSEVLKAEGEAAAEIAVADAKAKAIVLVNEAISKNSKDAVNYVLAEKYIEALEKVASGDNTQTVYLPIEATNVLGSIGGIKDLLKK